MEEKYKRWDTFCKTAIYSMINAQKTHHKFILTKFDFNNSYDKLFYKLSEYANTFIQKCNLYINPISLFQFIKFKLKNKAIKYCPKRKTKIETTTVHLCTPDERIILLDEIAKNCNMSKDEIHELYYEYYSGEKDVGSNN